MTCSARPDWPCGLHPALGRRCRDHRADYARPRRRLQFVRDGDVDQFRQLSPPARAETVADSGHAVQSDQPLALARLIEEFDF